MCVRTQLAPSAQTLQVGEASRIRRGSPERVLNSERSWPMSRKSISCRGPAAGALLVVDPAAEVDGGGCGAVFLPLLQAAARSANAIANIASRVFGARPRSRGRGGGAARGWPAMRA